MNQSLARYAWGVLAYNILVVLWGSLVRATGSGAGCGAHWPLCNGTVLPVMPQMHTAIEFTHRATSGLALLAVIGLYVWARRVLPRESSGRRAALFTLIFMGNETLVGAMLVLLGLVAGNQSPWRAAVLAVHLINTLFLLGSLTLTAWWATHGEPRSLAHGSLRRLVYLGIAAVMVLSAAGGVAAVGDTLFPASSVAAGMREEFARDAPLLMRLRVLHPVLAIFGGSYLLWFASRHSGNTWSYAVTFCVLIQFGIGVMNIVLLTPLWTQLAHLLVTDLLWISLVLFSVTVLETASAKAADDRVMQQAPALPAAR